MAGETLQQQNVDAGLDSQKLVEQLTKLSPQQLQNFDKCYQALQKTGKFNKTDLGVAKQCLSQAEGKGSNAALLREKAANQQAKAAGLGGEKVTGDTKTGNYTTEKSGFVKGTQAPQNVQRAPDGFDTTQARNPKDVKRGPDPFSDIKLNSTVPEPLINRDQMKGGASSLDSGGSFDTALVDFSEDDVSDTALVDNGKVGNSLTGDIEDAIFDENGFVTGRKGDVAADMGIPKKTNADARAAFGGGEAIDPNTF